MPDACTTWKHCYQNSHFCTAPRAMAAICLEQSHPSDSWKKCWLGIKSGRCDCHVVLRMHVCRSSFKNLFITNFCRQPSYQSPEKRWLMSGCPTPCHPISPGTPPSWRDPHASHPKLAIAAGRHKTRDSQYLLSVAVRMPFQNS